MPYQVFKHGPRQGQPKTLTDRIIRFLEEEMKLKEKSSGNRYRKFVTELGKNYWVGSSGAVRTGRSASSSVSLTDIIKARMIAWEKIAYPGTTMADLDEFE